MTPPIERLYFSWLCKKVNVNYGKPGKTFNHLLEILFNKEFVWIVPNDDNRLEDAQDLRYAFLNENGIDESRHLLIGDPPLSVLEVMIGLSQRLAFFDSGGPEDWAWRLIENLALHKQTDPLTPRKEEYIYDVLDNLIWRTYDPDGVGGFFPLAHPQENQTKVEIWYQMSAYLAEQLER